MFSLKSVKACNLLPEGTHEAGPNQIWVLLHFLFSLSPLLPFPFVNTVGELLNLPLSKASLTCLQSDTTLIEQEFLEHPYLPLDIFPPSLPYFPAFL